VDQRTFRFLSQRLASPNIFPLTREDRMRAYDRAGILPKFGLARTVYRLSRPWTSTTSLGHYTFDGRSFTATAQPLDVQRRKLLPEVAESGALVDLINVQSALAWDLLHAIEPTVASTSELHHSSLRCGWTLLKTHSRITTGTNEERIPTSAKPFA